MGESTNTIPTHPAPTAIVPTEEQTTWLDWNELEISRQLAMINHGLFKNIVSREFLNQAWTKRPEINAPNINACIVWFNKVL